MKLANWTAGLLAGMSMLALAAQADAGEVRVTVAEYSAKTGPYFERLVEPVAQPADQEPRRS